MSNIYSLKDEAKNEVYDFIDERIRPLPKNIDGSYDELADGFNDNDVDALRHAYVSGAYTMEYSEDLSEVLGRLNELTNFNSSSTSEKSNNMDLWNNAVGRKYGKKASSRNQLFEFLLNALLEKELIIDLDDDRKYQGVLPLKRRPKCLVIVIKESDSGENLEFLDVNTKTIMTKSEFVSAIKEGKYPKYSVKMINEKETPVSKKDRFHFNNLD